LAAAKKEDEKTRMRGKKRERGNTAVIRQTGNAFITLTVMANCRSAYPVPRVLLSVMFIIPDGQLDLTRSL